MPKEQSCVGERASRSSTKNAKDKSNSAALLASRGRTSKDDEGSGRASRCSSEKDSGYSDTGSDSLQTDLEDQRSSVSERRRGGAGGGGAGDGGGNRGGASNPLACTAELTPIYIIKNIVLKQPLAVQSGPEQLLHGQLAWGGGSGQSTTGPAQVLFIQQPPASTPLHILKPSSRKGKGTYLPILNSYPRIAPHPSKNTPEQVKGGGKGGVSEGQSLSKRVCTEERREAVTTSSQILKEHHHKQQEGHTHTHAPTFPHPQHRPRHTHKPPPSPSTSSGLGSPFISSSETPSSSSPASPSSSSSSMGGGARQGMAEGGASMARQRRFLNTVEILSQSGLLDITLRTQELLRQSAATERDIAQLRHHAQLLCQAAQAGTQGPAAWDRLLQAMAESGRYPGLCSPASNDKACFPTLEVGPGAGSVEGGTASANANTNGKNSPVVAIALFNHDSEVAPPSPLLAPTPDPPQDYPTESQIGSPSHTPSPASASTRGHRARSPLDMVMPPDSSTPGCLL
ncbi:hypothetical protein AGOR_G00126840 [Albula goreensis]|uniref:CLOCK-interacting pacemaker-like n=1 Tax=Albula goreensis TaxID=1534307 RepID=A0A8T3DH61_9TELE|nr:hypothetical protein AGOR_G00126840 [Albula goreensis]